ncbi:MAG: hypothetical protein WD009_02725 [Phycisphaeraceae bacterium]
MLVRRAASLRTGIKAVVGAVGVAGVVGVAAGARADGGVDWLGLPIRSQAEHALGMPGGEAEQHPQGLARSLSNPDRLYLSHDVGGMWRSDDGGMSWAHTVGDGLYVPMGQSVQVDPVNPDVVFTIVDNAWNWLAEDFTGLYRSQDAGRTWDFVLPTTGTTHQRSYQQSIAFDVNSVDNGLAQRWYAGMADHALYRSDDAGHNWSVVNSLNGHDLLYGVQVHPDDGDKLFVYSSEGLFASSNGGASLSPLGNLPSGEVTSVNIASANPDDIFVNVRGRGLYRSLNGGLTFAQVRSFNSMYGIVHPTDRDQIYLIGQGGANSLATSDGGQTWTVPTTNPFPGLGRDGSSWKGRLEGSFTALSPDPRDASIAAGFSRATLWRTTDGGKTFDDASAGFTGYNWNWFTSVASFDPHDHNRFAFFNQDVGMTITDNGGDWFDRGAVPGHLVASGQLRFYGMYAGDLQPIDGSQVAVAAAGATWNTKLIRTADGGQTWQIVDDGEANHLFIRFHTQDPNVVYAGAKRSDDGGVTWTTLPELAAVDGEILGMAESRPDTIYAMNRSRNRILRSDDRGETWYTYAQTGWTMRVLDSKPTFRVDPHDENLIYTIDSGGDLITFDGQQWRSLPMLDMAGDEGARNFVAQVAIDPNDSDIIYAGTFAAGLPFLFRTVDGGQTWEDISGEMPRLGIGGLAVHPLTGDVFVGGAAGTRILAPPYESPDSHYHRMVPEPGTLAVMIGLGVMVMGRRGRGTKARRH